MTIPDGCVWDTNTTCNLRLGDLSQLHRYQSAVWAGLESFDPPRGAARPLRFLTLTLGEWIAQIHHNTVCIYLQEHTRLFGYGDGSGLMVLLLVPTSCHVSRGIPGCTIINQTDRRVDKRRKKDRRTGCEKKCHSLSQNQLKVSIATSPSIRNYLFFHHWNALSEEVKTNKPKQMIGIE